jgi:dihydropteroate synthase
MKSDQLIVHNCTLKWGTRTYVMGILNITLDSFSGDGILANQAVSEDNEPPEPQTVIDLAVNAALVQARRYVDAGVDILDVGGESTRPGSQPLAADEEMERVLPVIKALAGNFDVLISVDSYKSQVAESGIKAGAHIINDVWGLRADPSLATIAARYQVPVILMHNRSSWVHAEIRDRLGGRYVGMEYENLLEDVKRELVESVELAHQAGVSDEHIILDPGIGFGKTVEQNLELIDRLGEIRALGYPVLFGPSRKSFIGYTLDLPIDQRVEGTAAAIAVGIDRGADVVRVHDVEYMMRVVKMTDAIVRRKGSS